MGFAAMFATYHCPGCRLDASAESSPPIGEGEGGREVAAG